MLILDSNFPSSLFSQLRYLASLSTNNMEAPSGSGASMAPIPETPLSSSPCRTPPSGRRRRPRRMHRPDALSLYDVMWQHAGTSLFVRPICWTDLHTQLLGAEFCDLPPCTTPVPPQSPRGVPASPSRCHLRPSAAATTLSRELSSLLAVGPPRNFHTHSIRTILSTLYPAALSRPKTQPDLHLYFGGLAYRDAVRVQLVWDQSMTRESSFMSFDSTTTRPAESFGIPSGGSSRSSQQPPARPPLLAYIGRAQVAITRQNLYRIVNGPGRGANEPVSRLQRLRSKMIVPANPDHDALYVGIFLAMAQRRFYGEPAANSNKWLPSQPQPCENGDPPRFHDVKVRILTNDNDTAEFMVYTAVVKAAFLQRFHEPMKIPRNEALSGAVRDIGLHIEYTRVPIWPILGLKERLGKALGKDVVGDFDEDNIETWEEEPERSVNTLKRRRDREALAEVFNGSFDEELPDGSPIGGKRICLVDEESGKVGVVV